MAIDTIVAFLLKNTDQIIAVPPQHVFLHAGLNNDGRVALWFAIDQHVKAFPMKILMVGNVGKLPNVGSYLGTVNDGAFVWHIFTDANSGITRGGELHYVTKDNGP